MKHINVSLFVPHLGCPHTCIFCNQKTISGQTQPLKKEDILSACNIAIRTGGKADNAEIAFFGGSFTAIPEEQMTDYLQTAKPFLETGFFSGIRISTRPDCINDKILSVLKAYGVTAIELGAQSTDKDVLLLNERGHSPEDIGTASALIRNYGFSLGLQMMTGLMGSTPEKDKKTASDFIAMKPQTVRIYPTVVLENTKLAAYYYNGIYTPPTLEESVTLCADIKRMFDENAVKVIRMGLHSGGNVEEGFTAGVYHPAFGELVEARIYRNKAEALLRINPPGSYTVEVPPGELSKMIGQKKENIAYFKSLGYRIKVTENPALAKTQCPYDNITIKENRLCT